MRDVREAGTAHHGVDSGPVLTPTADDVQLARMTPAGWARLVTKGEWRLFKHLRVLVVALLECITSGGRLVVNMPPGSGKSELISRATPSWYLGTWPENRVILASYGSKLPRKFGRAARQDFEEFGPAVFGLSVSDASSAADEWMVAGHRGSMQTVGIGGGLTGEHPHLLIIDDPIKSHEEALSVTHRDNDWEWYKSQARNRMMPGGAIVVVATRWNEDDLCGRLLKAEGSRWKVLNLPAICEDPASDPIGRKEGEALCPEMFSVEDLKEFQDDPYWWSAQYQGRPTPRAGGIIQRAWCQRFWRPETLPAGLTEIQSWDATFKATKSGSFVVGQVWGYAGADRYLLHEDRARRGFVDTCDALRSVTGRHPRSVTKLIEAKANGPAILDALASEIPGMVPIETGSTEGDKAARLSSVAPYFRGGNVVLPDPTMSGFGWVKDWIEEMCSFPNYPTNDRCDAASQALTWIAQNSYGSRVSVSDAKGGTGPARRKITRMDLYW